MRIPVVLGLAYLLAGAAGPQQPPDSVELDAIVTDTQGRTVTDLARSDFELFDDSRPQTLSASSRMVREDSAYDRFGYQPTGDPKGIPLRISAAAFRGAASNASVALAVEMRVDGFKFIETSGKSADRVELAYVAVDASGQPHSSQRYALTMDMTPQTVSAARERGFRVLLEVALPPGRYQLRIAAVEQNANETGSVSYDLDVPDFRQTPFDMSGVAITSAETSRIPTTRVSNPLRTVLPGPQTAVREFNRGDELSLFAEVYENRPDAPAHFVELATTVRADDGRIVFEHRDRRSSADLQWICSFCTVATGGRGGHGYDVTIPLGDFAPGAYVIRVEGRASPELSAAREVLIHVR